jgi:hypothetical protein
LAAESSGQGVPTRIVGAVLAVHARAEVRSTCEILAARCLKVHDPNLVELMIEDSNRNQFDPLMSRPR